MSGLSTGEDDLDCGNTVIKSDCVASCSRQVGLPGAVAIVFGSLAESAEFELRWAMR